MTPKSTAIVTNEEKLATVATLLESMKGEMARALPRHMTVARMTQVALSAARNTPRLLDCTAESLAEAILAASMLGLEPVSGLGHAFLIPYGKVATLVIGYRGLVELARRSGQLSTISADVVFSGEPFTHELGTDAHIKHSPTMHGGEVKPEGEGVAWVYAVAILKDGGKQFDVMSYAEVDAIRKRSKGAYDREGHPWGPWLTDWGEMAKKTVLRRLCKLLPMAVEAAAYINDEELVDRGVMDKVEIFKIPETASPEEPRQPKKAPRPDSDSSPSPEAPKEEPRGDDDGGETAGIAAHRHWSNGEGFKRQYAAICARHKVAVELMTKTILDATGRGSLSEMGASSKEFFAEVERLAVGLKAP